VAVEGETARDMFKKGFYCSLSQLLVSLFDYSVYLLSTFSHMLCFSEPFHVSRYSKSLDKGVIVTLNNTFTFMYVHKLNKQSRGHHINYLHPSQSNNKHDLHSFCQLYLLPHSLQCLALCAK